MIRLGLEKNRLVETLEEFEKAGVRYVLMDAYKNLPESYEGQDIDILFDEVSIKSIATILEKNGWKQTNPYAPTPWRAFTFATDTNCWIFLDFFSAKKWHSPPLARNLIDNSSTSTGYPVMSRGGLLAWKLFKDIRTGRIMEPARRDKIVNLRNACTENDIAYAKQALQQLQVPLHHMPELTSFLSCTGTTDTSVEDIFHEGREHSIKKNRYSTFTWNAVVRRTLTGNPLAFFKLISALFVKSRFALPAVAVVGIDGSGKTTLCDRFVKGEFKKANPLHIVMRRVDPVLPIYRKVRTPLRSLSAKFKDNSLGSMAAFILNWTIESGDFADRFYRFLIGRAWSNAGFGTVFFERYPTDRLIRTVVYPEFHFEKFFPHPDLFLHLDVDAKDSVERKKEDGHKVEIQREKRNNYLKYIGQFPIARTIDRTKDEDEVYRKATVLVWDKIKRYQ